MDRPHRGPVPLVTDRMVRLGPRQAERRAQTWRRLHETENLLARLDAALASRAAEPGDDLLRDACRVLAPLVARSPEADVQVSIGPDHQAAVRMRVDADGELCVQLVRCGDGSGAPATEVIPSSHDAAAAVASLLWAGGLDDEDGRTDPHPAPEA